MSKQIKINCHDDIEKILKECNINSDKVTKIEMEYSLDPPTHIGKPNPETNGWTLNVTYDN